MATAAYACLRLMAFRSQPEMSSSATMSGLLVSEMPT